MGSGVCANIRKLQAIIRWSKMEDAVDQGDLKKVVLYTG